MEEIVRAFDLSALNFMLLSVLHLARLDRIGKIKKTKMADTISSTITDNESRKNARLIKRDENYIINSNISKVRTFLFQACYKN